ncbi:MAG: hypothetical protein H3C47_11590 [Candidatus Cloacimonetes bacterium]|nr:hypothetical protein [Candidatus Cloacimonadota bacterium]
MPLLTLKLKKNQVDGSFDLVVDYESDPDALAFEHEEEHKALLKKLLGTELDNQDITRAPVQVVEESDKDEQKERQRLSQS